MNTSNRKEFYVVEQYMDLASDLSLWRLLGSLGWKTRIYQDKKLTKTEVLASVAHVMYSDHALWGNKCVIREVDTKDPSLNYNGLDHYSKSSLVACRDLWNYSELRNEK